MKTQTRTAEAATTANTPAGVNTIPRPTPKLMPRTKLITPVVEPSPLETTPKVVINTPKPTGRTPLMMPQRKVAVTFTPPQYDAHRHLPNIEQNSSNRIVRFKRGQVDDLAYLQDDMEFLTKLSRGLTNPQAVRLERSSHFRERQVERSIRTSEIFDIINHPKMFSYQKERVWKVEGQNGISILLAFSGLTTTGKQILLGITVYSEDSPETVSYKQWYQKLSNSKKLAKKSKKYSKVSL